MDAKEKSEPTSRSLLSSKKIDLNSSLYKLNRPIGEFNISLRLLNNLIRLNVETPLDILSLIYKRDKEFSKIMGGKSKSEVISLLNCIDPKIYESFKN